MQPHRQMTCSGFSFFVWGQGAQVAEHPVLRVLPDCAGVQDHQIRLPGVLGEGEAARGQHPHEPLAVGHVLLAAEGIHAGRGVGLPGGEHGADPLLKLPLAVQIRLGNTRSSVSKAVPPNSDTLTKVSYHTREKSTRKNRPGGRPGAAKNQGGHAAPGPLSLFIHPIDHAGKPLGVHVVLDHHVDALAHQAHQPQQGTGVQHHRIGAQPHFIGGPAGQLVDLLQLLIVLDVDCPNIFGSSLLLIFSLSVCAHILSGGQPFCQQSFCRKYFR